MTALGAPVSTPDRLIGQSLLLQGHHTHRSKPLVGGPPRKADDDQRRLLPATSPGSAKRFQRLANSTLSFTISFTRPHLCAVFCAVPPVNPLIDSGVSKQHSAPSTCCHPLIRTIVERSLSASIGAQHGDRSQPRPYKVRLLHLGDSSNAPSSPPSHAR